MTFRPTRFGTLEWIPSEFQVEVYEEPIEWLSDKQDRGLTLEQVIAAQVNRDQSPKPCPEWFRKAIEEARERIDTKETM